MPKKTNEKYECENCGLVIQVQDPCGCPTNCLVCCGAPMKPVKETKRAATNKAKPKK